MNEKTPNDPELRTLNSLYSRAINNAKTSSR
jgi:hypothetical protein